jgi:hypothetical protein
MSSPTENRKHKQFLDAALDSAITLAAREREVKRLDENKERLLSQIEEMSIPVGGRESLDEVQTYDRNVRTAKVCNTMSVYGGWLLIMLGYLRQSLGDVEARRRQALQGDNPKNRRTHPQC